MRSLLSPPSAVRYAARRVVQWRQQDRAVVLELEGVREPDATGIAAILAGAPLNDALDRADLTITVLESGAVRLQLGAAGSGAPLDDESASRTDPPATAGAGLLDPDALTPAPISVTTGLTTTARSTEPGPEPDPSNRLHLASERHGGLGPDPEDVTIEVTLDPFGLLVKDAGDRTVMQSAAAQPDESDEYRTAPFAWLRWYDAAGSPRQAATVSLALAPDERLAGLGERAGPLNLVGTNPTVAALGVATGVTLDAVDPANAATAGAGPTPGARPPFLLSSGGYGLLMHTAAGLSAELGTHTPAAYTLAVPTATLDVLILPGSWPRTALAAYARLTGSMDAPEPQAFGLQPAVETAAATTEAAEADAGADANALGVTAPARQLAPATVDEMRAQVQRGLSFGLATPGYWRAPLLPSGAPASPGVSPATSAALNTSAPLTPLQVRWAQLALLCPLVGLGIATTAAPSAGDALTSVPDRPGVTNVLTAPGVEPYAALRRRLLPYLLHCARETAQSGLPMLRPLLLEFSWDAQAAGIDDQFLLGRDLLVAPVFSESAEPVTRRVYLPMYANWYDWWTGVFYEGGQSIETTVPLDRLPMYMRAGTAVPLADPITITLADLLADPLADAAPGTGDAPGDVTHLLLFAPHDGAIGSSVELADDDLMGVEQERGERKARVYLEGIPGTIRDIEIVGLPAAAQLVDASSTNIALVPSDSSLPGLGGSWDSLTIRLEQGEFTAGLELAW